MAMTLLALPQAPVWVLDDQSGAAGGQPLALAGRLGLPFLRMPAGAAWRGARGRPDPAASAWALGDRANGPQIVLSAGLRGAARALTLRARHGSVLVHCTAHPSAAMPFDVLVATRTQRTATRGRVISGLGPLHAISPRLLGQARARWAERLAHLPRPHVVLVARQDGAALPAEAVRRFAMRLSGAVGERGGSLLASVSPSIGPDAMLAIERACKPNVHLLYRTDEPGDDPTLGFLGSADAVVMLGSSFLGLSEAAAADAPVFGALLEDGGARPRRLAAALALEGRIRPFTGGLSPWPRQPLDEAGRIAAEIRARLGIAGGPGVVPRG